MFLTYVVRPNSGPEGRGPTYVPIWDSLIEVGLRLGFGLQLLSLIVIFLTCLVTESSGNIFALFDGDMTDMGANAAIFLPAVSVWCIASGFIAAFRNVIDDDSAILHSRGFRAGTKAINVASTLEIISWTITFFLIYSGMKFGEQDQSIAGSGMLSYFNRILHALAMFQYSGGIFFLEAYHDCGVGEAWAWVLSTFYKMTGCFELIYIFTRKSNTIAILGSLFYLTALALAFLWSLRFEKLVVKEECDMTQCILRNEFFKSKNAMAYYGPPIEQVN